MKYIRLILFIGLYFLFSCSQFHKIDREISKCDSNIDSITALYFNYSFNSAKSIKCEDLSEHLIPDFKERSTGIIDAKIIDCSILKRIDREISLLVPDTLQYPLDTRISIQVFYKNGEVKRLCLNDMYPTGLYLNGVKQIASNKLLFLLKNNIGYYSWFEGVNDSELKDTTFVKEPFIESPYYKLYKENQKRRKER